MQNPRSNVIQKNTSLAADQVDTVRGTTAGAKTPQDAAALKAAERLRQKKAAQEKEGRAADDQEVVSDAVAQPGEETAEAGSTGAEAELSAIAEEMAGSDAEGEPFESILLAQANTGSGGTTTAPAGQTAGDLTLTDMLLGVGGLLALAAVAASNKDTPDTLNLSWTSTPPFTVNPGPDIRFVNIDATNAPSGGDLFLLGNAAFTINSLHTESTIDASGLTGPLTINAIDENDENNSDAITLLTGSGNTTVNAADADDTFGIDASQLNQSSLLTLSGPAAFNVTGLVGNLNASGSSGVVNITTGNAVDNAISIVTGSGATTVDGSTAGDTVNIDAEELEDGTLLSISGASAFAITNLIGNLTTTASGAVAVTLDNDGTASDTAVNTTLTNSGTGTVTVANGSFDNNDVINLAGTSPFVVTGLLANVNASGSSSTVSITTANAVDNAISIVTGSGATTVNGTHNSDTVNIDAEELADGTLLTISGASAFAITNLIGNLTSTASGAVSVILDIDDAANETVVDTTLTNNGTGTVTVDSGAFDSNDVINLSGTGPFAVNDTIGGKTVNINAEGLADDTLLTIAGASDFAITNLIGDLTTTASGAVSVTLDNDGAASGSIETTLTNNGTGTVTVANGSFDNDDEISLTGSGPFVLTGLLADVDASGSSGTVSITTAAADGSASDEANTDTVSIITGSGATTITGTDPLDTLNINAEALIDDTMLTVAGASAFAITNLIGDLTTTASGAVSVTLDNDEAASGVIDTTLTNNGTGTVTVANGSFDNDDEIDLAGSGPFIVTGLLANVDASGSSGTVSITTANAVDNAISITTGSGATTVDGTHDSDTVTINATALANNTALTLEGASDFVVTSLKGNLSAGNATGDITVSPVGPTSPVTTLDVQSITTGSGNDTILFGNATTSGAVSFALGAGSNTIETTNGADLSGATISSASGTAALVLAANSTVTLSSSHLTSISSSDPFNTILVKDVADGSSLGGSPGETLEVDTTLGALTGYTLDVDVEEWEIGVSGNGNNSITLGRGAQNVTFGTGNDTLAINGLTATGTLLEVETIDVSAGGNIAGAAISGTGSAGAAGTLSGTDIDFDDSTATLTMTVAQHQSIYNTAADFLNTSTGTQTIQFADGGTINSVAGIDQYLLASPTSGSGVDGAGTTITGLVGFPSSINVNSHFVQGTTGALTITSGTGNDAFTTSGTDAQRGQLTVNLASGGTDYLLIQNTDLNGLGGAGTRNGTSLGATTTTWNGIGGTDSVTINGFTPGNTGDKVVYLDESSQVLMGGFAENVNPSNNDLAFLSSHSVIEIDATVFQNNNPGALQSVATMLDGLNNVRDGVYYIVVYNGTAADSNALLYAATATEGDGFDFADVNGATGGDDTDTLELLAVFNGIGANAFTSQNFI